MAQNRTILNLSLSESNQLKGIALMLLLIHHLFYRQNDLYNDVVVHGHGLVHEVGLICKVCVALFVFCSGYGLTKKYANNTISIKRFYVERFVKLMLNFWIIWLLFIPLGVLCFDRTFSSVYGNHIIWKFIIQFMGLQDYVGFYGFNPTWWFMSCIIGLYVLYPYLMKIIEIRICGLWLLLGVFILMRFHIPMFSCLKSYLFPFVLGILCARGVVPPPLFRKPRILVFLIILTSTWRQFGIGLRGMSVDPFLAFEIILLFKSLDIKRPWIVATLTFIGHHSMNIFMFHTFIYYYYFKDFIYWTRNPLLILTTLLVLCLIISLKSASNLNGNLNCSKELEHYAS